MMALKNFIKELLIIIMLAAGLNLIFSSPTFQNSVKSLQYDNSFLSQFYTEFLQLSGNPTQAAKPDDATMAAAVQKVSPAVVAILGEENISSVFARASLFTKASAGTGFFIDPNGYILTNNHVIDSPNFRYTAELQDGTKEPVTIVFTDPVKDLAVLKISGTNFPTLNLGDSSKLKVGESVAGIGNAYGIATNAVSSGVVSGMNKSIIASDDQGDESLSGLIRTTAQLYPGDSGGPLFDTDGNVIGVDVATATNQRNLSFSIPINAAKAEIENVVGHAL